MFISRSDQDEYVETVFSINVHYYPTSRPMNRKTNRKAFVFLYTLIIILNALPNFYVIVQCTLKFFVPECKIALFPFFNTFLAPCCIFLSFVACFLNFVVCPSLKWHFLHLSYYNLAQKHLASFNFVVIPLCIFSHNLKWQCSLFHILQLLQPSSKASYQIAFNLAGGSAFEALQMELIVAALQGRLCLGPHFECLG